MINASSHLDGEASPEPGDMTICATCKTILTFGEAMGLRLATQEEIKQIEQELNQTLNKLEHTKYTLLDTPNGLGILCHLCGWSSSNKNDVEHHYCGHCHQFLED